MPQLHKAASGWTAELFMEGNSNTFHCKVKGVLEMIGGYASYSPAVNQQELFGGETNHQTSHTNQF